MAQTQHFRLATMYGVRWLVFVLLLGLAAPLAAGQGPQNVAVVINLRSWSSLAIAHKYAELRSIPQANMIYLDWDGSVVGTDVESFRLKILGPTLKVLQDRQILEHVTTIAYSSDFPYLIDFAGDIPAGMKIDERARAFTQGSLTGMTCLAPLVMQKNIVYANLNSNLYYRPNLEDQLLAPTRGFTPGKFWNAAGEPVSKDGMRYFLSTMLGYTSGRGNSYEEVEYYLRRALVADGTYPAGKIYFMKNGDVRAKTREPNFKAAVKLLGDLGVEAEIVEGILPQQRGDVMGAMLGSVDYRFADSGSHVRGGAIAENLTSFGGILKEDGGQTALSECLRAGAAGASGTVTEPFAIQAKFPHPMMHVHYASGCTLAESFYQAVNGPYQLLVVGDPLCRPWATIPQVRVAGLPENGQVNGRVTLRPTAVLADGKKIDRFELFVDGRLSTQCPAGDTLDIDTTVWADGWHELRVVAYEDSLIETQGCWIGEAVSNNFAIDEEVSVRLATKGAVHLDDDITIEGAAPGYGSLMLYQNQRLMAVVAADRGTWTMPARVLGQGLSYVHVLGMRGTGPKNALLSRPLALQILPPKAIAAAKGLIADLQPGLEVKVEGRDAVTVDKLAGDWLEKLAAPKGTEIHVAGVVNVSTGGLHQLQFDAHPAMKLSVNGVQHELPESPAPHYVPLHLKAGVQQIEMTFAMPESPRMTVSFGGQGARIIAAPQFGHAK